MSEEKKIILDRYKEALNLAEQLHYELNDCLNYLSNYDTELRKSFTVDERILDNGCINESIYDIISLLKVLDNKIISDLEIAASKQKKIIDSSI